MTDTSVRTSCDESAKSELNEIGSQLIYRRPGMTRPVEGATLLFFLAARFTAISCISCPSFDLLIATCMIRLMMLPVIQ